MASPPWATPRPNGTRLANVLNWPKAAGAAPGARTAAPADGSGEVCWNQPRMADPSGATSIRGAIESVLASTTVRGAPKPAPGLRAATLIRRCDAPGQSKAAVTTFLA